MASKITRKNLAPKEDSATQSLTQMNIQRTRMSDREFRDALTRAHGSVVGVKTNLAQWNRWSV
jgi:O-methyltransferase involved in polyketide biosynthesis